MCDPPWPVCDHLNEASSYFHRLALNKGNVCVKFVTKYHLDKSVFMGTSEISGQLRFLYICIENAWYILESLHNCYRLRKYDFEPGMLITFAGARLLWRTIRVVIILKNFTPVKWLVFPPGSCSTAPFLLVFHRKVHLGYVYKHVWNYFKYIVLIIVI